MIKITVDSTWEIIKAEPVATKEIYLDWNMEDWVYFQDWKYVKMVDVVLPETEITKTIQKAKARKESFIVNITTKNKKKKAVVISNNEAVEFDPERWDMLFDNEEQAQKYADEFNSKQ